MARRVFLALFAVLGMASVACSSSNTGSASPPPCVTDANEPNEGPTKPTNLGDLNDDASPAPGSAAATSKIDKTFSTHSPTDVDWYLVNIRDTGIGGNPQIRVMSDTHEATAFFTCESGTTTVACGLGTKITDDPDLKGALGCRTQPAGSGVPAQLTMTIECSGTSSDNGRLHVRVKRVSGAEACISYRLTVTAE
jgi:hypothetical protein